MEMGIYPRSRECVDTSAGKKYKYNLLFWMGMMDQASLAKSIGDRIRWARKQKNMNQSELARRIGVSQPAVANWETGTHDPRRIMLTRIADALGTQTEWLAAGDRSQSERDTHAAAAYLRRHVRHVPIVSERAAILLAEEMSADPHDFAEDYIPYTGNQTRLFALFVDDENVNAVLPKDSIAVIDCTDRNPRPGAICLGQIDNTLFVRRWCQSPAQFETASATGVVKVQPYTDETQIIGLVRAAIKIL